MAEPRIQFAQALQFFFVDRILTDRYTRRSWVGTRGFDAFLSAWSQIVREHPDVPRTVAVPSDAGGPETGGREEEPSADTPRGPTVPEPASPGYAPEPYHDLLKDARFRPFLHLLRDKDLGELMRVPYPQDTSHLAAAVAPAAATGAILEAIARALDKKPEDVSREDHGKVTDLDLSDTNVADLHPLKGLKRLGWLYLSNTQVADLQPLKGMTSLKRLDLSGTQVADLEPVKGLTGLQWLDLSGTQVADLQPLKGMTSLGWLSLDNTQVANLQPLKGLTSLQGLNLANTQVADLQPLKGMTSLEVLDLAGTQVADLQPLEGLTSLQRLSLAGTQVAHLQPLKGMTSLQVLHLQNTQVAHLQPLKGMTSLQGLSLAGTPVADEEVAELRAALPQLTIRR